MTTRAYITLFVLLAVLGVGTYFALRNGDDVVVPGNGVGTTTDNNNNGTPATTTQPFTSAEVRINSPLPNAVVGSPLTVVGEARGNWFFEANIGVAVTDANGKVLGQVGGQASGEWMTTNFVPFTGVVPFSTPTTATGFVVISKDNPSGLPQNDASVRMPIRFSQVGTTQTRVAKLYFYNQNNDKDASGNILCSAKGLVAVDRTIPLTNTPIQDAVKELLKGPTAGERAQLTGTEFPLTGVALTSASNSNGVLTLTFSDPQNKTTGGSCRVSILSAQIEATAKQFGGVTSVRFMPTNVFQP